MRKLYYILVVGLAMTNTIALTQNVDVLPVPYTISFEETETAELSNWVLNPGNNASQLEESWVIGNATASDGQQSLYISADKGESYVFGTATNYTYAYRDFIIPKGSYFVTFDWRCKGLNSTKLYAGIAAASQLNNLNASITSASLPPAIVNALSGGVYNNSYYWQNETFQFTSNGSRTLRLCFAWANANNDSTMNSVAACIDNIQITDARCFQPSSLQTKVLNCDTLEVVWEGVSEAYELEYRKRGDNKWMRMSGLSTNGQKNGTTYIEGLEEGAYEMRIRGICTIDGQEIRSAYRYDNDVIVFCPEKHCVNYVNLEDTTGQVRCYYGTYDNPYEFEGVINLGPEDKLSRHSVCWDRNGVDPITKRIPLVPEGELASIRIGNWDIHGEAEAIEYSYTVDESNAILLCKYAVVLEDPSHGGEQPMFLLEILDEWDNLINPTCGQASFTYQQGMDAGWSTCKYGSTKIAYKPWTVLGLNLEDYIGKDIRIRLTSYDCGWTAHFGYAYFTLNCAAARIYGTSCGEDTYMSIAAPAGFNYEWFDKYDNKVPDDMLSEDGRQLNLPASDTTTYRCHLSYKEETSCGFDLYSAAYPRMPVADFSLLYQPSDCKQQVKFTNKSHVLTRFNNVPEHHYDEACDTYEWIFRRGKDTLQTSTAVNPLVTFPQEGGTFEVDLTAYIAEGACSKDTTIQFTLPAIGDTEQIIDTIICEHTYIYFNNEYAAQVGEYHAMHKSVAGCDSTITLRITKEVPVTNQQLPDTIVCAEEPLILDGQLFKLQDGLAKASVQNPDTMGKFTLFYTNQYGCDSTIWMNVQVKPYINPLITVQDITDEAYQDAIIVEGSGYDYYLVNGEQGTVLTGLNGGTYYLEFYNDFGCSIDTVVELNGCLNVVFQRWNDVLSVKSPEYNGGHLFTAFQWYKGEELIEGATLSYYYASDGLASDIPYRVLLTQDNGEQVFSCDFYATITPVVQVDIQPTRVRQGEAVRLNSTVQGRYILYNMQGLSVGSGWVVQGEQQIDLPGISGIYLLHFMSEEKNEIFRISVGEK